MIHTLFVVRSYGTYITVSGSHYIFDVDGLTTHGIYVVLFLHNESVQVLHIVNH